MTETPGTRQPDQPGDAVFSQTSGGPQEGQTKQRTGKRILMALVGVVVALVVAFGVRTIFAELSNDLSTADVGDCIDQQADIDDIKVVPCDSEEAFLRVYVKTTDWTEDQFDDVASGTTPIEELCDGQPIPTGGDAIWYGEQTGDGSGKGDVYCLEPVE
jgi:hypothetical protein